jgi:hypothetical protein
MRTNHFCSRTVYLLLFVLLTVLTQIGGLVLVLTLLIGRLTFPRSVKGWQRSLSGLILFLLLYQVVSVMIIPPIAAAGGRVQLPCQTGPERSFAAGNRLYCIFNRNYVDPRIAALLTALSRAMARDYPGTITLYLDANFPFVRGFPLLPHLSHNDGLKLDIAYYYDDPTGSYLPAMSRSPIGYWAFEQPGAGDKSICNPKTRLTLRWDLQWLQKYFPERPLDVERTSAALRWLTSEGAKFDIQRIFIEPYLAKRLGGSSPLLGFQGCRAARHDDHIHIQIRP